MIKFFCPRCDNPFVLQDSMAGRKGQCPKCKIKFLVPEPGGQPTVDPAFASNEDLLAEAPKPAAPPRRAPAPPPAAPRRIPEPQFASVEPEAAPEAAAPATGGNKTLVGAGIAGGLVLVVALGYWLTSGGGEDDGRRDRPRRNTASSGNAQNPEATATPTEARPKMSPSQIMEKYADAVVRIEISGEGGKHLGHGSGFVASADTVVTNFHVIDGAESIQIKRKDGSTFGVQGVLAWDAKKDFAVLKVSSATGPWPTVVLGDSDQMVSGARIVTLGHSLGLDYTVSDGLFSGKADPGVALGEPMNLTYLQISAPISPGNSGGPLFDEYGEVVGVNTMCIVGPTAQNLNFALPINEVKSRLSEATLHPLAEVVAEGRKRSVADLLRAGERLLQERDRVRAFLVYKAAYEQNPQNADVVVGYADALNLIGQHHLAREKGEEALALQPGLARALRALGQSYYSTGDRERAAIALRRSLATEPDNRTALLTLAVILGRWKRTAEVVALADRALAQPTDDPRLLNLAIVAYAGAGNAAKAEQLLGRYPKGPEHENSVRAGKGFIALESGRASEAVEHLSRAVEASPDDPFLRLALARSLQEVEKWDQAIAEYKACLELEESLYPALKGLARLYDQRHLVREALTLYRSCVHLSPTDLEANLRLAQILGDIGEAAEAVPFLKTALERSPGYRPCVLALAKAYAASGQRDQASDMLAPLANANPPDIEARLALAEVYLDQGRPKDAGDLLLQSRTSGALLARKLYLYARALEAAERFGDAALAMDEAISLDAERGLYRYLRAVYYARCERRSARGALVAYLDWAANRQEEQQRYKLAQQLLEQIR